ncbi:MAG: NAD(P)/FAD-dependent oxidoreductase [Oscillospiraceae bacterium]|nr:NAD(P)/FAD-dependent oxidoreductase [Oscillospiraceae bacterium]
MKNVIVAGAGPAGLTAALYAARNGCKVRLLDSNGVAGKKLNITGKGRCNVTNDCDPDTFMANVPRNGRFLYSAFSAYPPREVMRFFESRGVPLSVERGRRVFPQSGRARNITDALTGALAERGVRVEHGKVTSLWLEDGVLRGAAAGGRRIPADAVIAATGGLSYPLTGSDGSGYALARQAGHTVTPTEGVLTPLESPDAFCAELAGLSLKNVTLSLISPEGKRIWREGPGEMLFTHTGLSGPLVLTASSYWKPGLHAQIDLKPGLDERQLDARVLRDLSERSAQEMGNAARGLLPKSLVPVALAMSGIDTGTRAGAVTRGGRKALTGVLKAMPVRIGGKAPIAEAIITRGGVDVREVNPGTMESKRLKGLYFAGELLDVDAHTGGFNLQIAFCTGFAAGIDQ